MTEAAEAIQARSRALSQHELRDMFTQHHQWLHSGGKEGKRAYFQGYDLRKLDFRGADLTEASFRGADARGVDFTQTTLVSADLSEAWLEGAKFRGVNLERCSLARAQAKKADFKGADLHEATLMAGQFNEADFSHAVMAKVNLREVQAVSAVFNGAQLTKSAFRGANMTGAIFTKADLTNCDCRDATFDHAEFNQAELKGTSFRGSSLHEVAFTRADFSEAGDVDPTYQAQSFDIEKRSIENELKYLRQLRDEMGLFEKDIQKQKRELERRRKMIANLTRMEQALVTSFQRQASLFKYVAATWMIGVSGFTALTVHEASKIPLHQLNLLEIGVVLLVLATVLSMHVFTAVLAYKAYQGLSKHINKRQLRLHSPVFGDSKSRSAEIRVQMPEKAEQPAPQPAFSNGFHEPAPVLM